MTQGRMKAMIGKQKQKNENTEERPAEAEIHLMINAQIAQQQPEKEGCSETL